MEKILIAGGDMRQLYCARRLTEKYHAAVIGFDKDNIPVKAAYAREDERFSCAVLPVPPLNESGMINTPCCSEGLSPEDVKSMLAPDAVIFAGRADDELRQIFSGHDVLDYMEREELSLRNAVPTAEGAVQIALEELPVTLSGEKVLIVGMGRIGTALAEILKGFGADAVRFLDEHAVAAVHAAAHDEIGHHAPLAVLALADDDAAARIGGRADGFRCAGNHM